MRGLTCEAALCLFDARAATVVGMEAPGGAGRYEPKFGWRRGKDGRRKRLGANCSRLKGVLNSSMPQILIIHLKRFN